jgi:N-methylhydantoinase A/oxoprolinase/acetone carboxylase beta subunit
MRLAGPAVIDSESTTVLLPPGTGAEVDVYGSLVIREGEGL